MISDASEEAGGTPAISASPPEAYSADFAPPAMTQHSVKQWDDQAALARIEAARWGATPTCPKCGATRVRRKTEKFRLGRWRCHACTASFTACAGTVLQGTCAPLSGNYIPCSPN